MNHGNVSAYKNTPCNSQLAHFHCLICITWNTFAVKTHILLHEQQFFFLYLYLSPSPYTLLSFPLCLSLSLTGYSLSSSPSHYHKYWQNITLVNCITQNPCKYQSLLAINLHGKIVIVSVLYFHVPHCFLTVIQGKSRLAGIEIELHLPFWVAQILIWEWNYILMAFYWI